MLQGRQLKIFIRVAIVCGFLSVLTTLGIHSSLFDLGELTDGERMRLFENHTYIMNRFWVLAHCLFVFIAMLGFFVLQFRKSPGFTILGLVFFGVFSFTEILRQMFALFYLNNLRRVYLITEDIQLQALIQMNIDHAGFVGLALFGLFILSFALGNICYGISLFGSSKSESFLAYMLILWGAGNLMALGNVFWQLPLLTDFIEYFNILYQPLMRLLITIWMIEKFKQFCSNYSRVQPKNTLSQIIE